MKQKRIKKPYNVKIKLTIIRVKFNIKRLNNKGRCSGLNIVRIG